MEIHSSNQHILFLYSSVIVSLMKLLIVYDCRGNISLIIIYQNMPFGTVGFFVD